MSVRKVIDGKLSEQPQSYKLLKRNPYTELNNAGW